MSCKNIGMHMVNRYHVDNGFSRRSGRLSSDIDLRPSWQGFYYGRTTFEPEKTRRVLVSHCLNGVNISAVDLTVLVMC